MKNFLVLLITSFIFSTSLFSQDDDIRPPALGVSFVLKDYTTASLIRATSMSSVLKNDKW